MSEEDQANLKGVSVEVIWGVIILVAAAMIFLLVYYFATVRKYCATHLSQC